MMDISITNNRNINNHKQAGTVLGQAQLKLELELYFTSFKICCIKLIKLVKLKQFSLLSVCAKF